MTASRPATPPPSAPGRPAPATSAFDCVLRGCYSLRANWQLVPVVWLQQVSMLALLIASAVAFVLPLGFGSLSLEGLEQMTAQEAEGLVLDLLSRPATLLVPLLVGFLASSVVTLLAGLVYSWFQGGVMAVLLAADRQALPGPPRDWRLFRTWDRRSFAGWGARLMWRFFWLINLYLVGILLVTLLWMLVIVFAVWGNEAWGGPAAVGIGCGGSLPLVFLIVVLAFWYLLAQAELPREGRTVRGASRRALDLLGRRLGAVLLIAVIFMGASLVLNLGFSAAMSPISFLLLPSLLEEQLGVYCFGQLVLYAVQLIVGAVLSIAFYGAMVALVQSEAQKDAEEPA